MKTPGLEPGWTLVQLLSKQPPCTYYGQYLRGL